MLAHEHGVDLSGVTWVQGAVQVGRRARQLRARRRCSSSRDIEINDSGRSLDRIAGCRRDRRGDRHARARLLPPQPGHRPAVSRLLARWSATTTSARASIRSCISSCMRRDVHERAPWAAAAMLQGVRGGARSTALAMMRIEVAPRYMLPWLQRDIEEMDEVFGPDPWPYGVEANRPTLEALVRYMVEQHYIPEAIPLEAVVRGGGVRSGARVPPSPTAGTRHFSRATRHLELAFGLADYGAAPNACAPLPPTETPCSSRPRRRRTRRRSSSCPASRCSPTAPPTTAPRTRRPRRHWRSGCSRSTACPACSSAPTSSR